VDAVIRGAPAIDLFVFGTRNLIAAVEKYGNVLCIATDVVIQQDVSDVFRQTFDVASCRYPQTTRGDRTYCGDVIFLKPSSLPFLHAMLDHYLSRPALQDGWEGGQTAFRDVVETGKFKVLDLDFEAYCKTPEDKDEDLSNAFIVHYRGLRKQWMGDHPLSRFGVEIG